MAKHSGSTRISRPISGARVAGIVGKSGGEKITRANWNRFTNPNVLAAEQSIRANTYETAFVFNASGNLISSAKGQAHSVGLGAIPENSIVTHNHPSGRSFSRQDILTTTSDNLSEIRAVGTKRTYSMKRPESGWGSREKLIPVISRAEIRTKERLTNYIRRGSLISPAEESKRIHQANELHWHLVWKNVAKEMGWEYRTSTT